jgi:uncharacterized membrane protein YccC
MSERGTTDPLMTAAARLEQAVERLAHSLSRPRAAQDAVPRAEVAALSARLDAALAKLKTALRDQAAPDDEGED